MVHLAVAALVGLAVLAQDAGAPEPDPARFEKAIRAFEAQDAEAPPEPGGIVFVGSSSIRLWDLDESFPGLGALNRGFGGSQLSDAVHYVDRVVVKYRPRLVVLYAGDNDIAAGKAPERIRDDLLEFARRVRAALPEVPVAVMSIKPSPARWALWDRAQAANLLIARTCLEDDRLIYVDMATPLLGRDGRPRPEFYREDGLHLSPQGYRPWADRLRPILEAHAPAPAVDRRAATDSTRR